MAWIVFPDHRIMELEDQLATFDLGDEVSCDTIERVTLETAPQRAGARAPTRPKDMSRRGQQEVKQKLAGDRRPAIFVSRKEAVEDAGELSQLRRNIVERGRQLRRSQDVNRFLEHYNAHRELLAEATGKEYPHMPGINPVVEQEFFRDLGSLVGHMQLIGAGTLKAGHNLVYVFRGGGLTVVMTPAGVWTTLLESNKGLASAIVMAMRLDGPHPFCFSR